MDKLVSVVTVTFNSGDGLRRTCDSVRAQKHVSIEHIIIDGGSTDVSADFLNDYARHEGVVVRSESDRGIFDAMNKGLKLATGDLIVFMNAADTFADENTVSKVLRSFSERGWAWLYGSVEYVDSTGTCVGVVKRTKHQQRKLELGLTFVPHQTMYVSSQLAQSVGEFDEELGMAADQDYAIRAGILSVPSIMPIVLCKFEIGGAHGNLGRIRRELIFHSIRMKNERMILHNPVVDRSFALLNGLRWALRDGAVTVLRGARPRR